MVSILYILARMGSKMVQEKFKNLARIDPWEKMWKVCKNPMGFLPLSNNALEIKIHFVIFIKI